MASAGKKRKMLSLSDRIKVLEASDRSLSARKVSEYFGVGKTQIQDIVKNKEAIRLDYSEGAPLDKRQNLRKTGNEEINSLIYEWFRAARSKNVPVSRLLIQEKAKLFAEKLGIDTFKWMVRVIQKTSRY